jgi:2-polyprenyl-3-methyl-5-hydroxy-6-metoxy-1,4-benzoquinol methylase
MDLCERGQMSLEEERTHWWIRTRFRYLERSFRHLSETVSVLEVGCGTAQNLRYLREHPILSRQVTRLIGLEPGLDEDVVRDGWMNAEDGIYRSEENLQGPFDVLVAMDVIEHVDEDLEATRKWLRLVKPGGSVFITVPAFGWLWSRHDTVLGHKRRYTKASLRRLARSAGLEIHCLKYAFSFLVLPAYVMRKLLPEKRDDEPKTDLVLPHPILNTLLYGAGWLEASLGGNPFFGTSVIGHFRAPKTVP